MNSWSVYRSLHKASSGPEQIVLTPFSPADALFSRKNRTFDPLGVARVLRESFVDKPDDGLRGRLAIPSAARSAFHLKAVFTVLRQLSVPFWFRSRIARGSRKLENVWRRSSLAGPIVNWFWMGAPVMTHRRRGLPQPIPRRQCAPSQR